MDRFTDINRCSESATIKAFYDELEKIGATVVMKKLSPVAKKFMDRMTGAAGGAVKPATKSARRLRHALTGKGSPELMTELHGAHGVARAAKDQSKKHFEGVLQSQGKVYKGVPGLEKALEKIPGHPRMLTRTGATMTRAGRTVSSSPAAKLRRKASNG